MCIHIYIHTPTLYVPRLFRFFVACIFASPVPDPRDWNPTDSLLGICMYIIIYILYLYVHTHTVYPSSNSGKHPRNMFVDRNTNMQPYIQKNHIYNFDYDHLYTWFLKTAENDRVITVFCAMSLDSQPLQVQCAFVPHHNHPPITWFHNVKRCCRITNESPKPFNKHEMSESMWVCTPRSTG